MLKLLEQLANLIQNWNDAEEEPDERARGNNLMCLILSETGSGLIGTIAVSSCLMISFLVAIAFPFI